MAKTNQFDIPVKQKNAPITPGFYYFDTIPESGSNISEYVQSESVEYIGTIAGDAVPDNPTNHRYIYYVVDATNYTKQSEYFVPKNGYVYFLSSEVSTLGSTAVQIGIPAGMFALYTTVSRNDDNLGFEVKRYTYSGKQDGIPVFGSVFGAGVVQYLDIQSYSEMDFRSITINVCAKFTGDTPETGKFYLSDYTDAVYKDGTNIHGIVTCNVSRTGWSVNTNTEDDKVYVTVSKGDSAYTNGTATIAVEDGTTFSIAINNNYTNTPTVNSVNNGAFSWVIQGHRPPDEVDTRAKKLYKFSSSDLQSRKYTGMTPFTNWDEQEHAKRFNQLKKNYKYVWEISAEKWYKLSGGEAPEDNPPEESADYEKSWDYIKISREYFKGIRTDVPSGWEGYLKIAGTDAEASHWWKGVSPSGHTCSNNWENHEAIMSPNHRYQARPLYVSNNRFYPRSASDANSTFVRNSSTTSVTTHHIIDSTRVSLDASWLHACEKRADGHFNKVLFCDTAGKAYNGSANSANNVHIGNLSTWMDLNKLTIWWRYFIGRYVHSKDGVAIDNLYNDVVGWPASYRDFSAISQGYYPMVMSGSSNISGADPGEYNGLTSWHLSDLNFEIHGGPGGYFIVGRISMVIGDYKSHGSDNIVTAGQLAPYLIITPLYPDKTGAIDKSNAGLTPNIRITGIIATAFHLGDRATYSITFSNGSPQIIPAPPTENYLMSNPRVIRVMTNTGGSTNPTAGAANTNYNTYPRIDGVNVDITKPDWMAPEIWQEYVDNWSFEKYLDLLNYIHDYEVFEYETTGNGIPGEEILDINTE